MCSRCRITKPESDFYWKVRARNERQSRCIPCFKEVRGARPKRYLLSDVPRECRRCRVEKPAEAFNFKNQKHLRRQSVCRECQVNSPAPRTRSQTLRRYGLTVESYQELEDRQGNACAICRKPGGTAGHERLYVDHCHETGNVRGLLCMNCNSAVGHFRDDAALLRSAADYLDRYACIVYAIAREEA
jgi:hypothetical protein